MSSEKSPYAAGLRPRPSLRRRRVRKVNLPTVRDINRNRRKTEAKKKITYGKRQFRVGNILLVLRLPYRHGLMFYTVTTQDLKEAIRSAANAFPNAKVIRIEVKQGRQDERLKRLYERE